MLNKTNQAQLNSILSRWYFGAMANQYDKYVKKVGEIMVLDKLTEIMLSSQNDVGNLMKERKREGLISDLAQSGKSVAGNGYQALVAYALLRIIDVGKLPKDICIALKSKNHPLTEKYAAIKVGEEVLKPDLDLLIYVDDDSTPLIINSLKTSLRERAGQTMRWKLLVDVATGKDKNIIKKYDLNYAIKRPFKVNVITADFYDEYNNPQNRGLFKFFDKVYVSRSIIETQDVKQLSKIVNDLRNTLKH